MNSGAKDAGTPTRYAYLPWTDRLGTVVTAAGSTMHLLTDDALDEVAGRADDLLRWVQEEKLNRTPAQPVVTHWESPPTRPAGQWNNTRVPGL